MPDAPGYARQLQFYHVKYKFTNDPGSYEAVLIRNDANGGFIRVKYTNSQKVVCLIEMTFKEEYLQNNTYLVFKGSNPKYIRGTGQYNPDHFWFKKNILTSRYESHSVSSPGTDGSTASGNITTFKLLDLGALNRSFVLDFFNTNEPFYKNLFTELPTINNNYNTSSKLHLLLVY